MPAKNGNILNMDYIRFGSGKKVLLILPGLGDGLQTVKGTALPMAVLYRQFGKSHRVYAFSRRNDLPQGYTTRDMAHDVAKAMDALEIPNADVLGVSMGGMIAQYLAIDHPEKVDKLVLAVTSSKPNPILLESLEEWIGLAKAGDHTGFMTSNLRRIYSETYFRKNMWMTPILGKLTKPKSYERFFIQAEACKTHDAYGELGAIQAPTLVIGGEKDLALGCDASREIAGMIPNAQLRVYAQWGHGVYEEEPEFNKVVYTFIQT